MANVVTRAHGAQAFRRVQEEDDSNADNQLARVTVALPKSFGFQLEAVAH